MKQERTNEIQIKESTSPYNKEKNSIPENRININYSANPSNIQMIYNEMMENSRKFDADIDKLKEQSNKGIDIENTIRQFIENSKKSYDKIKKEERIREEKNNQYIQQMFLDSDTSRKIREEEMNKDFEKKLRHLEEERNKELEKLRIEREKRWKQMEQKSLEKERKFNEEVERQKKLYEEKVKRDNELYENKLKYMKEKEQMEQKHFEEIEKMSKDLTEEKRKYIQMRNDFDRVAKQNKLLTTENNNLRNINQMNQQYIQYLTNQNNNRNIYYEMQYNNYYNNDIPHDNTNHQ